MWKRSGRNGKISFRWNGVSHQRAEYEGEQKTFADLLETVPGVYIDRLFGGGKGHYTTVRIRGSSASQVSIYMDGILINSGSESAVNLENINIDNIERIEVYRGYIPARFAGAAMGGAINIVTKRPNQAGGKSELRHEFL